MAICTSCGQTLPTAFLPKLKVQKTLRALIDVVYDAGEHGIEIERLFFKLYGNNPDGGPLSGHNCLHARITYANKLLRPYACRIVSLLGFYKIIEDMTAI
jgi:hypothetical protein